jgi:integrase/recombinase XerD
MSALTVVSNSTFELPALIARAGKPTAQRFLEFFTVNLRNPNTRAAYGRAAATFLRWCESRDLAVIGNIKLPQFWE